MVDILLYGPLWQYNAAFFSQQIQDALKADQNAEMMVDMNTEGGSPEYGMSIIRKIQQTEEIKSIMVTGQAHSMGAFALCYVENVSAVDTAQAVIHRAAYSQWFEKSEEFAQSIEAQSLTKMNKDLMKAFKNKIDVAAFEALPQCVEKGITLKSIFSMEDRQEVLLTAQDMKKIGLIQSIVNITPSKKADLESRFQKFNKFESFEEVRKAAQSILPIQTQENKMTTLQELKEKNPTLYAEAVKLGKDEENNRVAAWMEFSEIDAEAVKKGVDSGAAMTMKDIAAFTKKGISQNALAALETESASAVETSEDQAKKKAAEAEKGKKDPELVAFDAQLEAEMKKNEEIMSQEVVLNNGQQAIANTDLSKIFVWNNRYEKANYTNSDLYDPVTLAAGTLMGRIAATGEVVPLESGASDGSQFPVGVLAHTVTIDETVTQEVTFCVAGDVVEDKVIFQGSDTMATIVSSRRLRDRIAADTVGIKLVGGIEMTAYDNQ